MKIVILAGGKGTRLAEETSVIPKPMVEIGGRPILSHIMQIYAAAGMNDFVLALGYRGEIISDYFLNYHSHCADLSVSLSSGAVTVNRSHSNDWQARLVATGLNTMTGGRLRKLEPILRPEGTFMLTYGDGVSDVDIRRLLEFHRGHGKLATLTAVRPPARFGAIEFCGDAIADFEEKPQTGEGWINGGFMVFEPEIFDHFGGAEDSILEVDLLARLAKEGELVGYRHPGFWQCLDTIRDKTRLQELWDSGEAPWKVWE